MNKVIFLICFSFLLVSCNGNGKQSFINQYADVLLTKNNEIQFRFKFNDKLLSEVDVYKVKVIIEDQQLAKALGATEILYGEDFVYDGKLLFVDSNKEDIYLTMDPIPLQIDLHTFVLEDMIKENQAVKVEVFNNNEMIVTGYIEEFHSQF